MINWFIDRFGVERGLDVCNKFSYFLESFGGHGRQDDLIGILEVLYAKRYEDDMGLVGERVEPKGEHGEG